MRESLLGRDPEIDPVDMPLLVGVASEIEREAVQRYETLAATMERRGEYATAAAFRIMLEEERGHVDAVQQWAASVGQAMPLPGTFHRLLPPELSTSWNEIEGSARLTPYRAFAIAVENEERAFTLYSYLAAHAADMRVETEAERLAMEELRHAALMRRWRRQAYHRQRRETPEDQRPDIGTIEALDRFLARREARIATRHRALATRLRAIGDEESARVLEDCLSSPTRTVAHDAAGAETGDVDASATSDSVRLLVAAQEPLEALSEALEAVMRTAEGALFDEVGKALTNVVARLARIAMQVGRRMQAA